MITDFSLKKTCDLTAVEINNKIKNKSQLLYIIREPLLSFWAGLYFDFPIWSVLLTLALKRTVSPKWLLVVMELNNTPVWKKTSAIHKHKPVGEISTQDRWEEVINIYVNTKSNRHIWTTHACSIKTCIHRNSIFFCYPLKTVYLQNVNLWVKKNSLFLLALWVF